jgi:hypothetical protein
MKRALRAVFAFFCLGGAAGASPALTVTPSARGIPSSSSRGGPGSSSKEEAEPSCSTPGVSEALRARLAMKIDAPSSSPPFVYTVGIPDVWLTGWIFGR